MPITFTSVRPAVKQMEHTADTDVFRPQTERGSPKETKKTVFVIAGGQTKRKTPRLTPLEDETLPSRLRGIGQHAVARIAKHGGVALLITFPRMIRVMPFRQRLNRSACPA